jgi:signal transduction protein with GAF and PtsI domain
MGLRQFSMHPAQILSVKQKIMQSNCSELAPIVRRMLRTKSRRRSASSWRSSTPASELTFSRAAGNFRRLGADLNDQLAGAL